MQRHRGVVAELFTKHSRQLRELRRECVITASYRQLNAAIATNYT